MPIVSALAERGITEPFPIQSASLPDSLAGRDVLGRGRTGSGKTVAFALPVVTRLAGGRRTPRRPRALILAPTRELALQIDATTAPLAATMGLKTTTIFGGVAQSRQVAALDAGVDIVVACPGRLEDLLNQKLLTLDGVEVTVLDEADHMADLGFLPVVRRLLDRTPRTLGDRRAQRLLFSATLDNGVDVLVKRYLHEPVTHSVDDAAAPPPQMTHHVLAVSDKEAKRLVIEQLAAGTGRRVLFMRTKHHAKKLAKQLTLSGIPSVDLHGNLGQGARERNLAAFHSGEAKVLVATDIAARGIHVDDVELVVHVDPPAEHKAYLHRSGRTARAGSGGDVVTLMLPEQKADVADLTRKAKISVRPTPVRPGDATVTALAGEVLTRVAPRPEAQQGNGMGARQGAGQGGGQQGRRRQGQSQQGQSGRGQAGTRTIADAVAGSVSMAGAGGRGQGAGSARGGSQRTGSQASRGQGASSQGQAGRGSAGLHSAAQFSSGQGGAVQARSGQGRGSQRPGAQAASAAGQSGPGQSAPGRSRRRRNTGGYRPVAPGGGA